VTGVVVSGTFRCRTLPTRLGTPVQCALSRQHANHIVVETRGDRSNLRDFALDDFDADLSFAGVSESCHIAGNGGARRPPFTSVTGGYTVYGCGGRRP